VKRDWSKRGRGGFVIFFRSRKFSCGGGEGAHWEGEEKVFSCFGGGRVSSVLGEGAVLAFYP